MPHENSGEVLLEEMFDAQLTRLADERLKCEWAEGGRRLEREREAVREVHGRMHGKAEYRPRETVIAQSSGGMALAVSTDMSACMPRAGLLRVGCRVLATSGMTRPSRVHAVC